MKVVEELYARAPGRVHRGTGAPAGLIEEAEARLGVRFGGELRDYLARYGELTIGAQEVNGLWPKAGPIERQTIVAASLRLLEGAGRRGVVVGDDGGETAYAFLFEDGVLQETLTSMDWHSPEPVESWPDGLRFGAFIAALCGRVRG